jgi:protoporphyrinogen oxidase
LKHVRFCILGAGPSGLAFAAALKRAGCDSFVLLEKEPDAGGLCRSAVVDGAPLDIGGGHFLDIGRQRVLDFVFAFMPREEWREFKRVSTIRIRGVEVEHPLEGNLWQLPLEAQVEFLESIARAGAAQGAPEPTTFDAWMRWKLGDRITDEYMLPYNRKIWSLPLSNLGSTGSTNCRRCRFVRPCGVA